MDSAPDVKRRPSDGMGALVKDVLDVIGRHLGRPPVRTSAYFADGEFLELTVILSENGDQVSVGVPDSGEVGS